MLVMLGTSLPFDSALLDLTQPAMHSGIEIYLKFLSIPSSHSLFMAPSHESLLRQQVQDTMFFGAAFFIPDTFQYPKPEGSLRPILDLLNLNKYSKK